MFILLSFSTNILAAERTIKIGYPSTCPYACLRGAGHWEGYLVDILKKSNAASDKKNIEFVNIPLSRLLLSLKAKQIDLAILPFSSVRYESDYKISKQSVGYHFVGILKKTLEDKYYDYSSFAKSSVVVADIGNETISLMNHIRHNSANVTLTSLSGQDTVPRLVSMVKLGRATYGLADYNVLRHYVKQETGVYLRPSSLTGFSSLNLVSYFQNDKVLNELNKNLEDWLKKARKNGELKKILGQHELEDWVQYEQER